uniref:Uncharacterized protein n=1 Tax=Setaria viridis TaxID=4556 RepID=A0A4U6VQQ4_SETVI|nr:hypothetical protein SEVIR_2G112000v2 [Setaria viridis]
MVVLFVLPLLAFIPLPQPAADREHRGVGALRQAWRLMTRVWRKPGFVLVLVIHLVAMVPSPLYMVALGSMAMGMALLVVYALLSGLVELFYFSAATVYYYQAMESKEVVTAHDYVKIPTGEATV